MNKNPIIGTYVDGKFPHIRYEPGSVGWKFIELDNLVDRIVDEAEVKIRRFQLIGSIHYYWLISEEFFQKISFNDYLENAKAKVGFAKGTDTSSFMYRDHIDDDGFTMGILDLGDYNEDKVLNPLQYVGEEMSKAKGILKDLTKDTSIENE